MRRLTSSPRSAEGRTGAAERDGYPATERRDAGLERIVDGVLQLAVSGVSDSVNPLAVTRRPWGVADPFAQGRAAALRRAEDLLKELLQSQVDESGDDELRFQLVNRRAAAQPLQCLASVRLPRLNSVTDRDLLAIRRNDEIWQGWRTHLSRSLSRAWTGDEDGGEVAARILREQMQASAAELRAGVLGDVSLKKRLSKVGGALAAGALGGGFKALLAGAALASLVSPMAIGGMGSAAGTAVALEAQRRWNAVKNKDTRSAIERSLVVVTSL